MKDKAIIASWDWKADATEIADKINECLELHGEGCRFVPVRDNDDGIELLLVKQSEKPAPNHE